MSTTGRDTPLQTEITVVGVTVGDPAGIGPEVVVKALSGHAFDNARVVVFGDRVVLEQAMDTAGKRLRIREIQTPDAMPTRSDRGEVILVSGGVVLQPVDMGIVSAMAGKAAYAYYSNAIEWALKGWVDGIATAPIQKEALRLGGCPHLDHTAILKHQTGSADTTTLFMVDKLRVFFLTRHLPLRDVAQAIRRPELDAAIARCMEFLRQLGLENPTLAVAALNPHGGEEGMFGNEEQEILRPAVEDARRRGLSVYGPIPADAVFHLAKEGRYDGVLSLYHDQGHVAIKTLDFFRTVSLTMGQPFLRTSVDHGTAFDLAGKGLANEISMVEAIRAAARYAKRIRQASVRKT